MKSFKKYITEETLNKNFKKWFGKSKVAKGNKPLVVYHGSSHEFDIFTLDAPPIAQGTIRGFYFTKNPSEAKEYGKVIMPVYLSIQNMLEANPYDYYGEAHNLKPLDFNSTQEEYAAWKKVTPKIVRKFIEKQGYDGVKHIRTYGSLVEYIAFKPTQIKSVDNNGTFNPKNPNIYL